MLLRLLFRTTSIFVVFFSLSVLYGSSLNAQAEKSIEISPAILDIPSKPSEVSERSVTVRNINNVAVAIEVDVRSIVPEDEVLDISLSDIYDAKNWVTPETNYILLEPNESREVNLRINTPENAAPSSYALVVFRIVGDSGLSSEGGVKINAEAGTTVIVNTPGEVNELIEIAGSDMGRFFFGGLPNTNNYIQNKGSSHELPVITMQLVDSNGEPTSIVNTTTSLLLPNTQRSISALDLDYKLFRRYRLRISVNYGSPRKEVVWQTGSFVVLPSFKWIALWAIGISALVRYFIKNKFHKKVTRWLQAKQKQFRIKPKK